MAECTVHTVQMKVKADMTFYEEKVKIPFGAKHLDGILTAPAEDCYQLTGVILTHGAGGDMNFHHLVSLAAFLTSNGFLCLRFTCKSLNLVYRVKAYKVVVEYLKNLKKYTISVFFVGGRSMGARAVAAVARQLNEEKQVKIQGLICLSYPLHPPKQRHELRTNDLLAVEQPVLFISGTDDEMCERGLLESVVRKMKAPAYIHWIDGANHGLVVKGRREEEVQDEMNTQVLMWVQKHV